MCIRLLERWNVRIPGSAMPISAILVSLRGPEKDNLRFRRDVRWNDNVPIRMRRRYYWLSFKVGFLLRKCWVEMTWVALVRPRIMQIVSWNALRVNSYLRDISDGIVCQASSGLALCVCATGKKACNFPEEYTNKTETMKNIHWVDIENTKMDNISSVCFQLLFPKPKLFRKSQVSRWTMPIEEWTI